MKLKRPSQRRETPAEFVTKDELCRRLKKHPRTIERWQARGLIPSLRVRHSVLYDWGAVVAALNNHQGHYVN